MVIRQVPNKMIKKIVEMCKSATKADNNSGRETPILFVISNHFGVEDKEQLITLFPESIRHLLVIRHIENHSGALFLRDYSQVVIMIARILPFAFWLRKPFSEIEKDIQNFYTWAWFFLITLPFSILFMSDEGSNLWFACGFFGLLTRMGFWFWDNVSTSPYPLD